MNKITKSAHNWLAHKINNECFIRVSRHLKGRVLDLGCGTAPYKKDILNAADEYVGVDWENTFRDTCNIDVFCDLCKSLPFPECHADTVVSFQVVEHLPEPDFFLSECRRVLRPGGCLIITVPFMWHVHDAPYDYFRFTKHGLEYLLKKNGFEINEISENTGFWQMTALKLNYHTVRFAKGPLKYLFVPFWWLTQTVSPLLDRIDRHPQETASYTAVATKKSE